MIASSAYTGSLVVILLGLTLGLSLSWHTTKLTIDRPTLTQIRALSVDAQCPCSNTYIPYGQWVSIEAIFHEVCISDFVSDRWIEVVSFASNATFFYPEDFRTFGSALFRALANLCVLSETTVRKNLLAFNTTSLISPQLVAEAVLASEVNATVEQLKTTMANAFISRLQLVHEMTFGNRLVSALQTNIYFYYMIENKQMKAYTRFYEYHNNTASSCSCYSIIDCYGQAGIYSQPIKSVFRNIVRDNATLHMPITGLRASCLPISSLLQSTLECFYDQACLDELLSFLPAKETFTAMHASAASRFSLNSTVRAILTSIMVERWVSNVSYENYYAQCAPASCSYSIKRRHDVPFVLLEVVGLLGGLTSVLAVCVPLIRRLMRGKLRRDTAPPRSSRVRLHRQKLALQQTLSQMNIFRRKSNTHPRHVAYQRVATRFYFIALIVSLGIAFVYILLIKELYRETVAYPTELEYKHLQSRYPSSLTCPCTSLSVPHKTFISIESVFHQICSSGWISVPWLSFLSEQEQVYFIFYHNYRISAQSQFQLLATLCRSEKDLLDNALRTFLETHFISSQLIPEHIFDLQVNSAVQHWKLTTINEYLHSIQLIQATNHGNQLMNDLVNFEATVSPVSQRIEFAPSTYSNCSCALSNACHTTIPRLKLVFGGDRVVGNIEHFFGGCSALEALLQSTLQCFYNQTCVDLVTTFEDLGTTMNISRMNESQSVPVETVESIVRRLMIDQWQVNISFSSYYNICAPASCIYEYRGRRTLFMLFTTLISIYGGLSIGFQILAFLALRFAEQLVGNCSWHALRQLMSNLFAFQNKHQIASRLRFGFLVVAVAIFTLISFLIQHTRTVVVSKPSLSTYQDLAARYPDFLQCSCSQFKIRYQSFAIIEPRFHAICSSNFVTDDWMTYVYQHRGVFDHTDFRRTSTHQFQLLAAFCQLSQRTLHSALRQLNNTEHIDLQLSPPTMLDEQMRMITRKFQLEAYSSLAGTLDFIRRLNEANMLLSGLFTNWKLDDLNTTDVAKRLFSFPVQYGQCNCGLPSQCFQPSRGMMVGCYPLEALLRSTLTCFYQQQCIDANGTFPALNSTFPTSSRFALNASIEILLNELMVENYSIDVSYENYFAQCAPSSCSYSFTGCRSVASIFTALISFYGGMVVIVGWIVIVIMRLCRHRLQAKVSETVELDPI